MKMDDALVGTAAEMEVGIAKVLHERAVNQGVYIRKNPAQALVSKDFLVCKAGIAPYVLTGLFLDATGEFGKGLDLIEGVAAGEGDIGEFVRLHHFQDFIDRHFPASVEVPRLRIMAAGTMMGAARTVDRCAQARTVGHGLFQYIQYPNFHRFP